MFRDTESDRDKLLLLKEKTDKLKQKYHYIEDIEKCMSPIEIKFLRIISRIVTGTSYKVEVQPQIGPFIADFKIIRDNHAIYVELDDKDWHNPQIDAPKNAFYKEKKLCFIRFTGSQITANTKKCIKQALDKLSRLSNPLQNQKNKKKKKKAKHMRAKNHPLRPSMGYKLQKVFKTEDLHRSNTNTVLF